MADGRLEEIREGRLKKRSDLLEAGADPYPAEVRRTHSVADFLEQFEELETDGTPILLAGRVVALRAHGSLVFLDIQNASSSVQLQITQDEVPAEIWERVATLDQGDFIEATGKAIRTKRGTETLSVSAFRIITKSIRPLPDQWYGLKDHETRWRQRELDLLLNEESRRVIEIRSKVVALLREYFAKEGYLEVEAPVLQPIAGGAAAKPFVTHHNALDMPLYLRIASELYLKRLLAGGYEKVYEMGNRFRNEGVSRQHNPEFTMLESQWAYADYEDYMDFTEDILAEIAEKVAGSTTITWQEHELRFGKPLARERYVDLVSERLGVDILEERDPRVYIDIFKKEHLPLPESTDYTKLVDELYKELLRPKIIQPTILYDYPNEMVPLAKANATDPRVAEKFQVVVAGQEIVNAYTELNDPVEQRKIFEAQQAEHEAGNEEAHAIDEAYLVAMEYGMPPNAGWGLGVDRLVMLLTDSPNIRDTILFPLLKPTDV